MQVVVLCTVGEFLDDVLLLTATQSIQVFLKHSPKKNPNDAYSFDD